MFEFVFQVFSKQRGASTEFPFSFLCVDGRSRYAKKVFVKLDVRWLDAVFRKIRFCFNSDKNCVTLE